MFILLIIWYCLYIVMFFVSLFTFLSFWLSAHFDTIEVVDS